MSVLTRACAGSFLVAYMKSLDQRNKTVRIAFDLIVYFRLEQRHKFWRFCISCFFIQIKDAFGLGMTSMANIGVGKRSVHFQTCCGSFSALFYPESNITMIVHMQLQVLVLQKVKYQPPKQKRFFVKTCTEKRQNCIKLCVFYQKRQHQSLVKLTD